MNQGDDIRQRATQVVADLAARLADPATVAAVTDAPGNVLEAGPLTVPIWRPETLGDGYPGVGLLFAELAAADPRWRAAAHAHLTAAAGTALGGRSRLFSGAAAVAFVGQAAACAYGGYSELLEQLDRHLCRSATHLARQGLATVRAGQPIGDDTLYDVLSGITGLGRYLLARRDASDLADATLTEVLRCLVAIAVAGDVRVDGVQVPAWWGASGSRDCLNVGLAHGVPGPLALLALCWLAGIRIEGQDAAIAHIVALLDRWRRTDDNGPYWPLWVTLDDHRGQPSWSRRRDAWCYGAAGVGWALDLAGIALDRADWRAEAAAALRGSLATANDETIDNPGLCHGWAGLLHIARRMAIGTVDVVAERVLDAYAPDSAFGFRYYQTEGTWYAERPGFLDGVAGVALALHSYATGEMPRTGWDAALLLS
ncbi:lanthionine synthetase C family protein [Fodinicola feengrottensis]